MLVDSFGIIAHLARPWEQVTDLHMPVLIDENILRPDISNSLIKFLKIMSRSHQRIQQIPNLRLGEEPLNCSPIVELISKNVGIIIIINLNNNIEYTCIVQADPQIAFLINW